jgi:hypothetical protein
LKALFSSWLLLFKKCFIIQRISYALATAWVALQSALFFTSFMHCYPVLRFKFSLFFSHENFCNVKVLLSFTISLTVLVVIGFWFIAPRFHYLMKILFYPKEYFVSTNV